MRIFRTNALKACIGILIAVLVTVNIGAAQAFDPNSANTQGDGVVNYVNVDTSAGKVITNFEYEVFLRNAIELRDGNVLLSGYMRENWEDSDSGNCNFIRSKAILVKLTPKGRLVTSFADGGVFTYERLDTETFGQTVEDSSGNIYVIGGSTDFDLMDSDLTNGCDVQSSNPFILKINASGTLNSSFGSSGSVISIPGIDNLSAIALSGERLKLNRLVERHEDAGSGLDSKDHPRLLLRDRGHGGAPRLHGRGRSAVTIANIFSQRNCDKLVELAPGCLIHTGSLGNQAGRSSSSTAIVVSVGSLAPCRREPEAAV